jgi:erythromycin esterase
VGRYSGLRGFTIGDPAAGDLSDAFRAAGLPRLFLDLRTLPKGPVRTWFETVRPMREDDEAFAGDADASRPYVVTELFDTVIYVEETTRARPLR